MKQWLISDTHFGHKKIIEACNRPTDCDQQMIDNWKKLVAPDDMILHLGDVFMGPNSKEFVQEFFHELPGHKDLILGNHDHQPISFYESLGFTVHPQPQLMWKQPRLAITHYPLCDRYEDWDINIHGHIHNNGYAPGTPRKRRYVNISVEVTGYAPVLLEDVTNGLAGQTREQAGDWPFHLTYKKYKQKRLDSHFCEVDRCPQV